MGVPPGLCFTQIPLRQLRVFTHQRLDTGDAVVSLMQVQIIPPQYIVKGNIVHREKTSLYGAGFAFRVNGLDDAAT
ncbi:hypothetical protein HMPREF0239_04268, partial [Clostridium sp. ATCC BAA-442]